MKISAVLFLVVVVNCPALRAQDSLNARPRPGRKLLRAVAAPVILTSVGLLMIDADKDNDLPINRYWLHAKRQENFSTFHTTADNYMIYAPIAAVAALDIAGVKGKHDIANQTALLLKSEILMLAMVYPLKHGTSVLRPDGSDHQSFPSGHTAQAFAAATFLHKEYGSKSIWYSIGGYSVATAVGACRVLNNRHWLSDVLVGAGIGIFSTNIVYLTHQNRWGKKSANHAILMPTYNQGAGFYFAYQFK